MNKLKIFSMNIRYQHLPYILTECLYHDQIWSLCCFRLEEFYDRWLFGKHIPLLASFTPFLNTAFIWHEAVITALCKNSVILVSVPLSWSFRVNGKKMSHFQVLILLWTLGKDEEQKSCPFEKWQACCSGNKYFGEYSGLSFRVW